MNDKKKCPNCGSSDITVSAPPAAKGTDFWDHAECNNCGYPDFSKSGDTVKPPKR